MKILLFDLDGTLLDTLGDLTAAMNAMLNRRGYPERTRDEVKNALGYGAKHLVDVLLPEGVGEDEAKDALLEYKKNYAEKTIALTCPYPGVKAMLREAHEKGYRVGVVSNKPEGQVLTLMAHFFPETVEASAGDKAPYRTKPAPDNLIRVAEMLGGELADCVLIGDSEADLHTAENCSIPSVIVTWGFREEADLIKAGAKNRIHKPSELWDALSKISV